MWHAGPLLPSLQVFDGRDDDVVAIALHSISHTIRTCVAAHVSWTLRTLRATPQALSSSFHILEPTQALAEAQRQRAGAAAALRALDNALARMRAERALAAGTAAALTAALAEAACRTRTAPEPPAAGAPRHTAADPAQAAIQLQRASDGHPGDQADEACGANGNRSAERGAHVAGALAGPLAGADEGAALGQAAGSPAALQGSSNAGGPVQHAEPAPASACTPACSVPGHAQAAGQQGEPAGCAGRPGGDRPCTVQATRPSSAEVAGGGAHAPRQLCGLAEQAACSSEAGRHAGQEPNAAGGGGGSADRASADASVGACEAAAPRFLTLAELAAAPLSVPLRGAMQAPDQAPGPGERAAHAVAAGRAPLLARVPCLQPEQARRASTCGRPAEHEAARVPGPGASDRRLGKANAGGGRRAGCLRSSAELSALLGAGGAVLGCGAW